MSALVFKGIEKESTIMTVLIDKTAERLILKWLI